MNWTEDRIDWLKRTRKRMSTDGKNMWHGCETSFTRSGIKVSGKRVISFTESGVLIENNDRPLFVYFVVNSLRFYEIKAIRNGTTISWKTVLN